MRATLMALTTVLLVQPVLGGESTAALDMATTQDVQRTLLAHLVTTSCQKWTCVLTIQKKAIDPKWLNALADKGKLIPLQAGDFDVKDGATGAFRRADAKILNLGNVRPAGRARVAVTVEEISHVMNRTTCTYLLGRDTGAWTVDGSATICMH